MHFQSEHFSAFLTFWHHKVAIFFDLSSSLLGNETCRWVYEGVIDDPYGEFFIAENKSLQKV